MSSKFDQRIHETSEPILQTHLGMKPSQQSIQLFSALIPILRARTVALPHLPKDITSRYSQNPN